MNPADVASIVASKLASSQAPPVKTCQSEAKKGGGSKVPKRKEKPNGGENDPATPKRVKVADKGKGVVGEATPFAFPMLEKDLHENSIFNPSYDHPQLVDKLVGKEDKGLIWDVSPGPACHMAQFIGFQLAVTGRELEKMWVRFGKQRDEEVAKLKGKIDQLTREGAEANAWKKKCEEKDAEIARLKEDEKKKEEEFAQSSQAMMEEAATYLMTRFDRAKFQVSWVHPTADLSMLDMLIENENFKWPPQQSNEEGDDEEGGGGN